MSATSSGGGKANSRAKDQARAAFMQAHPGQFPDSVMRPHQGVGSADRDLARRVRPTPYQETSTYERGLLGGILAHKIGYPCALTQSLFE